MRRIALPLLAAVLLAAALPAADIPRPALPLEFVSHTGERILLPHSYKGKVVVVEFLLTHCPACQESASLLSRLQVEFAARGLQVVGVAVDPGAGLKLSEFVRKYGVNFPVGVYDAESARNYMQIPPVIRATYPQFCFIDRKGMIREQVVNDERWLMQKERNLRASIEKFLAEGAPAAAPKKKK